MPLDPNPVMEEIIDEDHQSAMWNASLAFGKSIETRQEAVSILQKWIDTHKGGDAHLLHVAKRKIFVLQIGIDRDLRSASVGNPVN